MEVNYDKINIKNENDYILKSASKRFVLIALISYFKLINIKKHRNLCENYVS